MALNDDFAEAGFTFVLGLGGGLTLRSPCSTSNLAFSSSSWSREMSSLGWRAVARDDISKRTDAKETSCPPQRADAIQESSFDNVTFLPVSLLF
jgi:hypothetical protein